MTSHLLSLTALHAAAPGVLDVVFGPDGEFEGAPPWAGPMTSLADDSRRGWLVWRGALNVSVATNDGHWSYTVDRWRERWALDLRIPSVAARLAGLCARALGFMDRWSWGPPDGAWGVRFGYVGGGPKRWMIGCACYGFAPIEADVVDFPALTDWTDAGIAQAHASFLSALTLALAPRIAALRSTP
jgi:hypothetical protein